MRVEDSILESSFVNKWSNIAKHLTAFVYHARVKLKKKTERVGKGYALTLISKSLNEELTEQSMGNDEVH